MDYFDQDGFLLCNKCHTRKQTEIDNPFGVGKRKVPIACQCEQLAYGLQEQAVKQMQVQIKSDRFRQEGLTDPEYRNWTFDKDDKRDRKISDLCRKYVDEWQQMRANNTGLLFYGGVGTGKTFYGCCIANELLKRGVPALVTNLPIIINKLRSFGRAEDKLLDKMQSCELVVIDDLGAERATGYALEQAYMVIDTRYRSGKPLIVTTNFSVAILKNPENLEYARIYDRILQNTIPIKMTGTSRRTEIAAHKRDKYQRVLGV